MSKTLISEFRMSRARFLLGQMGVQGNRVRLTANNTPINGSDHGTFRLARDSNPFDYAEGMNSDVTVELKEVL